MGLFQLSLKPLGFLNGTQFLGAMNDNIFKLLLVYYCISLEGKEASSDILSAVGALYVLPFLLLSSTAGTMADRYSKRTIIIGTKIAECVVMILGVIAFFLGSKLLAYGTLFLLACHSAIFAPCKYGIVPELVPREGISKANGLLSSSTYIAIIVGTFLASFFTEVTDHNFVLSSGISLLFAVSGLWLSVHIPKTAPSGSKKEVSPKFLTELVHNLKRIYAEPSLLSAVLGSAFFLFAGSFIQLNMIPFAIDALNLSDVAGGYLFLLTALGIGIGSLLAGKLSGKRVELGFVPLGGFGIALSAFLMSQLTHSFFTEVFLIMVIGIFGGLYLVPLDSYIQIASPNTERGQVIATNNFLGFFGVLLSAGLLYLLSALSIKPAQGFLVIALLTFIVVLSISIAISGYIVRFWNMIRTRFFFKAKLHVPDTISMNAPSIYLTSLPLYPWVYFLTAIQPRRVCVFYLEKAPKKKNIWQKAVQRLTLRYSIESFDDLRPGASMGKLVMNALERGTSIALFSCQDIEMIHAWQQDARSYQVYECKGTHTKRYELQVALLT